MKRKNELNLIFCFTLTRSNNFAHIFFKLFLFPWSRTPSWDFYFIYNTVFGRMLRFEPELLRPHPAVLPRYAHPYNELRTSKLEPKQNKKVLIYNFIFGSVLWSKRKVFANLLTKYSFLRSQWFFENENFLARAKFVVVFGN